MHIARQHTFAAFAISVLESTLTVLEPALRGGNQGPQLDKIQRWLRDCIEAMPRRRGSAGADREATALYQRIEPYFVTMQQTDDERLATWLANLWMSATLASDVMAICPDITHPARRAWGYLLRTLTTLCERCLQLVPDCDVQGTARYMDVLRDYDAT